MSPVSRGRTTKSKKTSRSSRQPAALNLFDEPGVHETPPSAEVDTAALVDELMSDAKDMVESEDPLDAEVSAAMLLAMASAAGGGFLEALTTGLIPAFEARASVEAHAMLLALGAVGEPEMARAASSAADRLREAGVAPPRWADELDAPVTLTESRMTSDEDRTLSILVCSFRRARRDHAFLVTVDHIECGEAADVVLLDDNQLPEALRLEPQAERTIFTVVEDPLGPPELRWQLEKALDARMVHDAKEGGPPLSERTDPFADMPDADFDQLSDDEFDDLDEMHDSEDDALDYQSMALLLRARLATLPAPTEPKLPHGA